MTPGAPPDRNRYKASGLATFDGPLATRYDRSLGPRFCRMGRWDDAILGVLGSSLDGAHVLDVGCATGRLAARLAPKAARLAAVDIAPAILETARGRLAHLAPEAELEVADVEARLPFGNATFDVATLTGVLHHLTRPVAALAEIRRVLRPGGRLVVVDPCFFPPMRQIANALLRVVPVAGDHRFYGMAEAARLLDRAGYRTRACTRVAIWSYLIDAYPASQ